MTSQYKKNISRNKTSCGGGGRRAYSYPLKSLKKGLNLTLKTWTSTGLQRFKNKSFLCKDYPATVIPYNHTIGPYSKSHIIRKELHSFSISVALLVLPEVTKSSVAGLNALHGLHGLQSPTHHFQ